MRQLFILFFALFVVSCSKNPVPKPDNLLDEETMINILYDISLLQAIDGSMPNKLMEQDINMDKYIFESLFEPKICFLSMMYFWFSEIQSKFQ